MGYKNYFDFEPAIERPVVKKSSDLWFVFKKGKILMQCKEEKLLIPNRKKINRYLGGMNHIHYIGQLNEIHCFAQLGEEQDVAKEMAEDGLSFTSLRSNLRGYRRYF